VITDVELEPCTVEAQLYSICLTQTQSFSVTTFVIVQRINTIKTVLHIDCV